MTWPKTGATHYHAQLELLRQSSCNQRVCCSIGVGYLLNCSSKMQSMFKGDLEMSSTQSVTTQLVIIINSFEEMW